MNKILRVTLNILIIITSIAFAAGLLDLLFSIQYANREIEDPAKSYAGVFEYEIKHRAYGEIMGSYYSKRMDSFDPPAGYEDLYHIGEYAHTSFMSRVYEEKGDPQRADSYREKKERLKKELGSYEYTADEIDGFLCHEK
ncbi:MAG: hypothetical protein J5829_01805 [Lachnospiraceae bacterium]|nr:hypothetical protein [Lachnospiraceae bacterium]